MQNRKHNKQNLKVVWAWKGRGKRTQLGVMKAQIVVLINITVMWGLGQNVLALPLTKRIIN